MDIAFYATELISVAIIALLISISPGADFVMVTRNSLLYHRSAGLYSTLGISLAIWVHVAYSIAGVAIIIAQSVLVFSIIKYCGALYLLYIGWKMLRAKASPLVDKPDSRPDLSNAGAFRMGFMTNMLNPKTSLFFISLFSQFVDAQTPLWLQISYGLIISLAHGLWFSLVAIFLSQPRLLAAFERYKQRIEQTLGVLLIAFGLKVASLSNP